ncbi:hypothetical protein ACFLS1_02250 [Verrucomicrobiota bacterium]
MQIPRFTYLDLSRNIEGMEKAWINLYSAVAKCLHPVLASGFVVVARRSLFSYSIYAE